MRISSGRQPVRQKPKDLTEIDSFLVQVFSSLAEQASQNSRPDSNAMKMRSLLSQRWRYRCAEIANANERTVLVTRIRWPMHASGRYKAFSDIEYWYWKLSVVGRTAREWQVRARNNFEPAVVFRFPNPITTVEGGSLCQESRSERTRRQV